MSHRWGLGFFAARFSTKISLLTELERKREAATRSGFAGPERAEFPGQDNGDRRRLTRSGARVCDSQQLGRPERRGNESWGVLNCGRAAAHRAALRLRICEAQWFHMTP